MRHRSFLVPAVLAVLTFAAPAARAHITLQQPAPREEEQKEGPCGSAGSKRGRATTYKPGETITVRWKETIGHPGHFRISFDPNGESGFVDPKAADDFDTAPTVLVDNIKDKTGTQVYEQSVTLPDVECEKCTLQLIQVMTDKPPYGDGNDLYYQCADITLSNAGSEEVDAGTEPSAPAEAAPSTPDADSGCRVSTTSRGPGAALIIVAALGLLSRKRARR